MPTRLEVVGPRAGAAPLTYRITEPGTFDLQSVFAHFDGSGASGNFRPCITIKSQDGTKLARVFPSTTLAAGDVADVTYAPFLRADEAASAGGGFTQFWRELSLYRTAPFTIPDSTLTQITFGSFGAAGSFVVDPLGSSPYGGALFLGNLPGIAQAFIAKLSLIWLASFTAYKRIECQFGGAGAAPLSQIGTNPQVQPSNETGRRDWQEMTMLVAPNVHGADGPLEMKAYAYQESGLSRTVQAQLDIFGFNPLP